MRVLAVPNWSFGRDRDLSRRFGDCLEAAGVTVHDHSSDIDHNRTVTAFSGEAEAVRHALFALCELAFDRADLNRHVGVHPRIGALDVCPFLPLEPEDGLLDWVAETAERTAERFDLPVYLYERSGEGAELPKLRKGGFGGMLERELSPDFGPPRVHPRLGASVMGVRDWLIAMNVNLSDPRPEIAKSIATEIRRRRREDMPGFQGVRALGWPLASRETSQVSLNLTRPSLTPVDDLVRWIERRALDEGTGSAGRELIGVIRVRDAEHATSLPIRSQQIVETSV